MVIAAFLWLIGSAFITLSVSAEAVNFGSINACPSGKTTPAPCAVSKTVTFDKPAGIAAGKSCTLQVEFKPIRLGPNANTITIATNTAVSPKVPARGTATGVDSVSTVLELPTITAYRPSETMALTVTNYGVPGSVTVGTLTGAESFKVTSNTCTAGVTQGNSCAIQIEYAPAAQGTLTAYLQLTPSTGPVQYTVMQGTYVHPPCSRCTSLTR